MRNLLGSIVLLILAAALLWLPDARAAMSVARMYEVEVPVADQSAEARSAAASVGLLEILARVSGLESVPSDTIPEALAGPERFYSRYSYRSERIADERQWRVILQFEPSAVQRLAREAQLPIWSSRRPQVIAWIASRPDGNYRLAADEDDPVRQALEEHAHVRGVPLTVPEELPPARMVWEGAGEPLSLHARSLDADWLLIGQLRDGGSVARGRFELRGLTEATSVEPFDLRANTVDELIRRAVNRVTNSLARRYAVLGGDTDLLTLRVQGVNDVNSYATMMRYLQSLEYLTGVGVGEVGGGYIELWLETSADEARLSELLIGDGRMELPAVGEVVDLHLTLSWRG